MTDQELKQNFRIICKNQKDIFEAIKKLTKKVESIDYNLTYGTYKAGK